MKAFLFAALGLTLCLLLSSCEVTSVNPLSPEATAQPDQRLVGDWRTKTGPDASTLRFSLTKGPWMHVDIIYGLAGEKKDSYDLFPTVIGHDTFFNVLKTDKDDAGHVTKCYYLVRYTLSGNRVLRMWMMSQDAAAAAVRAGKLKGVVAQDTNPTMTDKSAHTEVDVTLQDSSANLVKFIQTANLKKLFADKMEPLYRVK